MLSAYCAPRRRAMPRPEDNWTQLIGEDRGEQGRLAVLEQILGRFLAMVDSDHEQPIPIFQQLARGHPVGRDDVRETPLSLRNVEDLLAERGIDISHETVRFWWNRFGPMSAAEIRKRRVAHMRSYPQWRWHLDEVFVKVNGKLCYLWRT